MTLVLQVELKELAGDASQQARFNSGDNVEVADLDAAESYTVLYPTGTDSYLFMHNTTFEQVGSALRVAPAGIASIVACAGRVHVAALSWPACPVCGLGVCAE